ncbi:MAG: IS701 family transposase [Acidimicrobiales bacterium]
MLSRSHLPTSLRSLLVPFRSLFTAPSYTTFCLLVAGFLTHTGERTVCGMLTGAGLAQRWHHSRAHRFFANAPWSIDALGRLLATAILAALVPDDAPIQLVVDDTLMPRTGRKVFGALWCHDGSATGPKPIGFGNCFVVVGVVVALPFCRRPVCLPVFWALWQKGESKVATARRLIDGLSRQYPDRPIHVVGDAAYASRALRGLPHHVTWTSRLRKDAALYQVAPARTGRRGRPRTKGARLPPLAELAATLPWVAATVTRYASTATVELAHRECLWYTPFGSQVVQLVMVREAGHPGYGLALVSTDRDATAAALVERYAARWSIEVAFEEAKQITGVGEARNRTEPAVRRTVPFGFACQSLLWLWYATSLHDDAVVADRRQRAPWYRSKETPSTLDLLITARRVLIAARFRPGQPEHPTPTDIREVQLAWALAAA